MDISRPAKPLQSDCKVMLAPGYERIAVIRRAGRVQIEVLESVHPDTRNPVLANMLELLAIAENRYSGIPTMRKACIDMALPLPEFRSVHGEFIVTFRSNYGSDGTVTACDILDYCEIP